MQTVIDREPKYLGLIAGRHTTNRGNHSRAAAGDGKWKREVTDRKLADGRMQSRNAVTNEADILSCLAARSC